MFIIDYGPDVNTVWVVRLPGGVIKHFYSDDIRVFGNPMNGNGWDIDDFKTPDNDTEHTRDGSHCT